MYGFISIENTVIVFGTESRGVLRDALSHLSQVLLCMSCSTPQTIHSSDPLRVTAGSNPSPPFTSVTTSLNFPIQDEDAGILGDRVQATGQAFYAHFFFLELFTPLFQFSMLLLSQLFSESLLVEVDCVSEA